MKNLFITALFASFCITNFSTQVALAQSKTTIPASHAKGQTGNLPVILINRDYGSSISFLKTDEVITKAWLGQTNAVEVGFDNSLGQAKIMYLKQDAKTENINGTSLTVITQNSQKHTQLYSFLLEFKSGKLANSIWTIEPEKEFPSQNLEYPPATVASTTSHQNSSSSPLKTSELKSFKQSSSTSINPTPQPESQPEGSAKPSSPISNPQKNTDKQQAKQATTPKALETDTPSSSKEKKASPNKQGQANALVRGLIVANRQGQITLHSSMNRRVNYVVRSLRKGEDIRVAAQSANVSWSVIDQLLKWGKYDSSLFSES